MYKGRLIIIDNNIITIDNNIMSIDNKIITIDDNIITIDNKIITIDNNIITIDNNIITIDNNIIISLFLASRYVQLTIQFNTTHIYFYSTRLNKILSHSVTPFLWRGVGGEVISTPKPPFLPSFFRPIFQIQTTNSTV